MKLTVALLLFAAVCGLDAKDTISRLTVPAPKLPPRGGSTRIVNGDDARLGEFPFQASLRFVRSSSHTCGGSIITSRHILSAGHCVYNGDLYVVVGTIYLNSGGDRYEVASITRHENYGDQSNYWRNDVSVLTLASSINFNSYVQQASLPSSDISGGSLSSISGWGTIYYQGPLSNTLQKVDNWPVIDLNQCRRDTGINLYAGHLCAGAVSGTGVCNGDSGGPLSRNGVVYGIASFVFTPCGSGYPDVWTRVAYYVDWIENVVGAHKAELKYA